jgi:tRNA 2-thiouridine synthesizing protein A
VIADVPVTDEVEPEAAALIATIRRLSRGICRDCTRPFDNAEALFSIALGFKNAPRCLPCLARGLARAPANLRRDLLDHIQRRDCYRQAWESVGRDGDGLMSVEAESRSVLCEVDEPSSSTESEWDAGNMSCGDLVLALRIRLNAMPPGNNLKIIARDPAAPEDLPSWCRLTGHTLLESKHPEYLIRRKEK